MKDVSPPIAWTWHGPRVTPFSRIDLEGHSDSFNDCLETMGVELDEAVLVVRGKRDGKTVEFQVGSLQTQGEDNGMVLIHRAGYHQIYGGHGLARTVQDHSEHRLLLDCELVPGKDNRAYTIRIHDEQGF